MDDVKEQMMLRLDEIGENCENLKAKVVSYNEEDRKICMFRWT